MKKLKFAFHKLVRDTAPAKMQKEGITVNHHKLDKNNHIKHLKEKLIEEAHEVVESVSNDELASELADILDIVDAICHVARIKQGDINNHRKQKYDERGGFEEGYYVENIEVDSENQMIEYFLKNPKKYPLID